MQPSNHDKPAGFTIIELLVTVAIIGILTAIGIAYFTRAQEKARDSRRMADLKAIQDALQLYYNDYQHFPNTDPVLRWNRFGTRDLDPNGTQYIKRAPEDPGDGLGYFWRSLDDGDCYCISAPLETALPDGYTYPCSRRNPANDLEYTVSCP
jgi:prepilin-type N-terminal cleavage/methylation domain-containing protein